MAGKRGSSGPPGNMHAAKSGATSWIRRRRLPHGKEHIARLMARYQRGLMEDKGGEPNLTTAEMMLIDQAIGSGGAWRLILDEAMCEGFIIRENGGWGVPAPVAKIMATYMNTERLALISLGLQRLARDVTPITEQVRRLRVIGQEGDGDGPEG